MTHVCYIRHAYILSGYEPCLVSYIMDQTTEMSCLNSPCKSNSLKIGNDHLCTWSDIPPSPGDPVEPSLRAEVIWHLTDPKRAGPLPPKPTSLAIERQDSETLLLHLSSEYLHLELTPVSPGSVLCSHTEENKTKPNTWPPVVGR